MRFLIPTFTSETIYVDWEVYEGGGCCSSWSFVLIGGSRTWVVGGSPHGSSENLPRAVMRKGFNLAQALGWPNVLVRPTNYFNQLERDVLWNRRNLAPSPNPSQVSMPTQTLRSQDGRRTHFEKFLPHTPGHLENAIK